jgi:putative transposase
MPAYQFQPLPKYKQLSHIHDSLGVNRFVWNKLLAMNVYRLEHKLPIIGAEELAWYIAFWQSAKSQDSRYLR